MRVYKSRVWVLFPPEPNQHGERVGDWKRGRPYWCHARQTGFTAQDGEDKVHAKTFELTFRHRVSLGTFLEFRGQRFRVDDVWENKATVVRDA